MNYIPEWTEVSRELYWRMLEIVTPAVQTKYGFLVGEATSHRACTVIDEECAAYRAFHETEDKRFFEASEPMTLDEFLAFRPTAPAL